MIVIRQDSSLKYASNGVVIWQIDCVLLQVDLHSLNLMVSLSHNISSILTLCGLTLVNWI
jgi:hypothetical protein